MRSFYHLSLVFIFLLSCSPSQAQHASRQDNIRHRPFSNPLSLFDTKQKRDANAVFTYFVDGAGACGSTNGPNDFIVALNAAQYANGAHCFEMITITVNGKTAQAQITDECLGCESGDLDFSEGLFEYFAPLSEGELRGSWVYNSNIVQSSSTTAYTPAPTPTTTTPTSFSSTTLSTTILTSSTTASFPTSTTATLPTSTPQEPNVITQVNLAVLELGALLQNALKLSA